MEETKNSTYNLQAYSIHQINLSLKMDLQFIIYYFYFDE